MESRSRLHFLIAILLACTSVAQGRVFMTQQQALAGAFPAGAQVRRETFFLTAAQIAAARKQSGLEIKDQLIIRYVGKAGDRILGYAYFDTHRVRTLPETLMIVVAPDSRVQKIDVLSFDEPSDYLPKRRWLDQILRRRLDDDLTLTRAVRPMSGASLTAAAIVNASRRILALHSVLTQ